MATLTRRRFAAIAPAVLAAPLLPACSGESATGAYARAAERTWRPGSTTGLAGTALSRELVRLATLAPSSHNTQCWKFSLAEGAILILPDFARRCPAVDPDDHHLFISLGCAAENMGQAAAALGYRAEARYDAAREAIVVALAPAKPVASEMFNAISRRQSTRGDFDARPLASRELALLEGAGTSDAVRLQLLTGTRAMEQVLDFVIEGNTAQMADPAFMRELRGWMRFNGSDAVRTGDGLYSATSGNPTLPSWLGDMATRWLFTAAGENDKYRRQIRSSAGIAVFTGNGIGPADRIEVGRSVEKFALQATALGIRTAFLNQPVEVASIRPRFADALGLAGRRPDLVLRFGRGAGLPVSLRRPVDAVVMRHDPLQVEEAR